MTIGSDALIGTLQKISCKSVIHFSRWISPHVFSTISPLCSMKTSTEGSDLFNFLRPYNILWLSSKFGVDILTFKIDFVWDDTGTKDIQS